MIIVFGQKKGGCGKSTNVINVAGVLANRGHKVCVVDADTNESINNYIRRREITSSQREEQGIEPLPFIKVEVRRPEDKLVRDLRELNTLYDFVLVDTGGYENNAFKSAITTCHCVYMPFQPCQADLEQIKPTLSVISAIEDNIQMSEPEFKIDCRMLVSLVDGNSTKMLIEAREVVKSLLDRVSISSAVIKKCITVQHIQPAGTTLSDKVFSGKKAHAKRAMFEILADEICGTRSVLHSRNN